MKTIVSLCCFSEMLMSKDKINAFSVKNTKVIACFCSCIRVVCFFWNTVQTGNLYLYRTLWKGFGNTQEFVEIFGKISKKSSKSQIFWHGFGNTQEEKMFYLVFECKARMHLFLMWFSKHGWFMLFNSSSVKL